MPTALDAALPLLRCPVCHQGLSRTASVVRCAEGHAFDIARRGHVSLLRGDNRHHGDTAEMIAARDAFLAAGHYAPIAAAVVDAVGAYAPSGPLLDLAAGTGWYAAAVLEAFPARPGVAFDVSTAALRRASRAHARLAAVGADAWSTLPVRDAAFGVVLSVFGPRTSAEIARVLAPGGVAVVVTPTDRHLAQIRDRLGMLEVGGDKADRLRTAFVGFAPGAERTVEFVLDLDREAVAALAGMGPTGHHVDPAGIGERVGVLGERTAVTASVRVNVFGAPRGARREASGER